MLWHIYLFPIFAGNFIALAVILCVYIYVSKYGREGLGGTYLIDCLKRQYLLGPTWVPDWINSFSILRHFFTWKKSLCGVKKHSCSSWLDKTPGPAEDRTHSLALSEPLGSFTWQQELRTMSWLFLSLCFSSCISGYMKWFQKKI